MNSFLGLKQSKVFSLAVLLGLPLTLVGCGGGGSSPSGSSNVSSGPGSASSGVSRVNSSGSMSSVEASENGSSSISLSVSSFSSDYSSPSYSSSSNYSSSGNHSSSSNLSSITSSATSGNSSSIPITAFVDVSSQFTPSVSRRFHLLKNSANPAQLYYFPKQLALRSMPGVASAQRSNKVSNLLKMFLDLSEWDWSSSHQITLSTQYSLDVDIQALQQEVAAAGFTELTDLKVHPPVTMFENRYTTSVPLERIQVQCKNLTLLINNEEITLHDCKVADSANVIAAKPINITGGSRVEALNFDADAISGNKSLRGNLSVDYTLPGTQLFDGLLSTNNGSLHSTWQLHFLWPVAPVDVRSTTLTIYWKTLLASLNKQVSAGTTQWSETAIDGFVAGALMEGSIASPNTTASATLRSAIARFLKQELFVAIYSEAGETPLLWAPRLRAKNVDRINSQQITLRHFVSGLSITSMMDLGCLTMPDAQNNMYRTPGCDPSVP